MVAGRFIVAAEKAFQILIRRAIERLKIREMRAAQVDSDVFLDVVRK